MHKEGIMSRQAQIEKIVGLGFTYGQAEILVKHGIGDKDRFIGKCQGLNVVVIPKQYKEEI